MELIAWLGMLSTACAVIAVVGAAVAVNAQRALNAQRSTVSWLLEELQSHDHRIRKLNGKFYGQRGGRPTAGVVIDVDADEAETEPDDPFDELAAFQSAPPVARHK